jgi:hypothetical protein
MIDEKTNFGLKKYSEKIYSQYYEDGMIREALESVNSINEGFFVDVGSWDGVYLSNTYILIRDFGFKGICIESNEEKHNQAVENFQNMGITCINTLLSTEKDNSLDYILNKNNCPKDFDFLSIDTEGSELQILNNIDFDKYQIKVICVENNFGKSIFPFSFPLTSYNFAFTILCSYS